MGEKNSADRTPATCPRCGASYTDYPALSRKDNKTLLCPDCGVREALESLGLAVIEQNEILQILHRRRPQGSDESV